MTVTVIGQITHDTLIFPNDRWRVINNLGGVLYTVGALASTYRGKIYPICNIGEDIYDWVEQSLTTIPNVEKVGVSKVNGRHLHCYILFASEYGTQYDEGVDTQISFQQVKPFLRESSFILVSPMTGYDLSIQTLKRIKREALCPIYLDYHILSLQRDRLGNRYLHRRKNWRDWCSCCDHLQMNIFEAESLSQYALRTDQDLLRFARPILDTGVKSVVITQGKDGAHVLWRSCCSKIQIQKIQPIFVPEVCDATGCGDVFAAGFIAKFVNTQDIIESYEFANRLAAYKCTFSGFDRLREFTG